MINICRLYNKKEIAPPLPAAGYVHMNASISRSWILPPQLMTVIFSPNDLCCDASNKKKKKKKTFWGRKLIIPPFIYLLPPPPPTPEQPSGEPVCSIKSSWQRVREQESVGGATLPVPERSRGTTRLSAAF